MTRRLMSALGMSLGVPFVIMAAAAPAAGVSQSSAAPVEERAFQTNPTSQSGPRIFDATSARGVADGKPVQPGELFTPEENPIYVWFRHEGCAEGATITSNWHYLGSQPPLHIAEARATVGPAANWGQFNLELAPGKRWPIGEYRVELRIDGTPAAETRFRVAAGESRSDPPLYTHPRAGYRFAPPVGWTVNDHVSSADVQMRPQQGDGLIEITSGPMSVRLDPVSYAAGWESKTVGPGQLFRAKRAGRALNLDGEIAYEAVYEGDGVLAKVLFVGVSDRFYVFTSVFPRDDFPRGEATFDRLVQSFGGRRQGFGR